MIGRTISHFQVLEKLGGGAMGEVYKAIDTKLGRTVALKFLPARMGASETAKRRFTLEARAASGLDHENICTIHEIGETAPDDVEASRLFIAMAFYEGETLKKKVDRGKLPIDEVIEIGHQIARGLAKAHQQGIIHRDIKPANVIVTDEGRAVILDFGLAKLIGADHLTQTGVVLGTVAYMSPEQTTGDDLDFRTDQWSLGAVLYQMATGRLPFAAKYELAMGYQILNEDPESLDDTELWAIVGRLLNKRPEDRYSSTDELVDELGQLAHARRDGKSEPLPSRWSPGKRGYAVIAAVVVALVLAIWIDIRFMTADSGSDLVIDDNAIAVMPMVVRGDPELAYLSEGLVDLISMKLDGAGPLRSIDPNVLLGVITKESVSIISPSDAIALAGRLGAGRAIMGNLLAVGDKILLSGTLYSRNMGSQVEATISVDDDEELLLSIDEFTRQIVGGLLQNPDRELASAAAVTTSSLPALKAFLRGEQASRTGSFVDAVKEHSQAVALDSTFAIAWARLGTAAAWMTRYDLQARALEHAYRYRGTLPDRSRRLVEAGYFAFGRGDPLRALDLYRTVLESHSNDLEALRMTGEVLFHYNPHLGRDQSEAAPYFNRALNLAPDNAESLPHTFEIATMAGRFDEADSLSKLWVSLGRDPRIEIVTREMRAIRQQQAGDAGWQFDQAEELGALGSYFLYRMVSTQMKDMHAAGVILSTIRDEALFSQDARNMAQFLLGRVAAAEGRLSDQAEQMARAGSHYEGARLVERVLLHSLPVFGSSDSLLGALQDEIAAWDTLAAPINWFGVADVFRGQYRSVRAFLSALVAIRLGQTERVEQLRQELRVDEAPSYAGDNLKYSLRRTVDALDAWNSQRPSDAIKALDEAHLNVRHPQMIVSPLFEQGYQRYLKAELLLEVGRQEEALALLASLVPADIDVNLGLLGPMYLRSAQAHESMGNIQSAVTLRRLLLDLWRDSDPALDPIREDANSRLARLEAL